MVGEGFTKKAILVICSFLIFLILTVYTIVALVIPEDLLFHLILGALATFFMFAAVIQKIYILPIGFVPFFIMLCIGDFAGLPPYENIAFSAMACLILASFVALASRLRHRTD